MKVLPPVTAYRLFRRYRDFRAGKKGPIFVSWFLTGECPIRCAGCVFFSRHPTPPVDLSLDDKLRVLEGLEKIRQPFLFIAGGEPCVSPDLPVVLKEARERGIYTILVTSGLRMDPELARTIDRYARGVIFSIDGVEEEHDRIRGKGNYGKAMEGIETLMAERKQARVYVSCVLGKNNHIRLEDFAGDMRKLGVDRINFQSNCIPQLKPGNDAVPALMDQLRTLATGWSDFFVADDGYLDKLNTYFTREDNNDFCGVPSLGHLAILPDGVVSGCCEFNLPIGDAVHEGMPAVLERARAATWEEAKKCSGCCRKDYDLVERFFERPVSQWSPGDLRALQSI